MKSTTVIVVNKQGYIFQVESDNPLREGYLDSCSIFVGDDAETQSAKKVSEVMGIGVDEVCIPFIVTDDTVTDDRGYKTSFDLWCCDPKNKETFISTFEM